MARAQVTHRVVVQRGEHLSIEASYEQHDRQSLQLGDVYRATVRTSDGVLLGEKTLRTLNIEEFYANGPGCGEPCRVPVFEIRID